MALRSMSHYNQRADGARVAHETFPAVSLQRAKEEAVTAAAPGDLPKPQAPPVDPGRGAQPAVLTPLVIPHSLCAKLCGKFSLF